MSEFDWMDDDTSWLDREPSRRQDLIAAAAHARREKAVKSDAEQLEWLLDDPKSPLPQEEARARARDPEFAQLARMTREFSPRQQLYMKCLLANEMTPTRAMKAMSAVEGRPTCHKTVTRWAKNPKFRAALEKYAQLALHASAAQSPVSIILRTNAIVEDALTPVPRFHDGRQLRHDDGTPAMEVDRASALKGLDSLAKIASMYKRDEAQTSRVTVILDFSGGVKQGDQADEKEEQVLDGEFTEVKK